MRIFLSLVTLAAFSTSFTIARAAPATELSVLVSHPKNGRTPASSCLKTERVNFVAALSIVDYSICTSEEIAAVKDILKQVEAVSIRQINDSNTSSLAQGVSYGYLGSARATLAYLNVLHL